MNKMETGRLTAAGAKRIGTGHAGTMVRFSRFPDDPLMADDVLLFHGRRIARILSIAADPDNPGTAGIIADTDGGRP